MRIIVFGGAGFLGSHVADVLSERGHEVIIFDLVKSPYLRKDQISIVGDITDQKMVEEAVKDCDVVCNFAGIADIDNAKARPLDVVKINILGNAVLLEASRKSNIKRFVFASSLYVYGETGSFYRSSKQACELLIENYNEIFGLKFTILRYGSLYGPRASENNWISRVLKQALSENKIVRHGDGEEIRDYIHVCDASRLSASVLTEEYENKYIIITGNQQIKIKDLMIMIKEMLNSNIEIEFLPVDYSEHYKITPYTFNPKLATRLQGNHYVDLGQGILDLMGSIYDEHFSPPKHTLMQINDK